jgi:hypothetical protein
MAAPRQYPSGAQKRRLREERKRQELLAKRADLDRALADAGYELPAEPGPPAAASTKPRPGAARGPAAAAAAAPRAEQFDRPPWALEFEAVGMPDLEQPEGGLDYVRKLQLVALRQRVTTHRPDPEQVATWRGIADAARAIGLTQNRTALEQLAAEVKRALSRTGEQTGAVRRRAAHGFTRPPTARGGGRTRGPRPVPRDGPGPDPGPDERDPPDGGRGLAPGREEIPRPGD